MDKDKPDNNNIDSTEIPSFNIGYGTAYSLLRTLVIGISNSIFFIILARVLPDISELGLISGSQLIISLAVVIATLGLNEGLVRFMSTSLGASKMDESKRVGMLCLKIVTISAICVSTVMYLLRDNIAILFFHDIQYSELVTLSAIDILLYTLISVLTFVLISFGRFRKVAVIAILNSILKVSFSLLLLFYGGDEGGPGNVVKGFIIADAISLALFVYSTVPKIWGGSYKIDVRSLLRYSLPLYGATLIFFISSNLDYYLVLVLSNLSLAGIYGVATAFATVLLLILVAFDQVILPYMSRMYGRSAHGSIKTISTLSSRYLFLIFIPVGILFLSSAPLIIVSIFGERYVEAILPSMIMILAITLTSPGTLFNNILKSYGRSEIFLISSSVAMASQFLISFILIPNIGIIGGSIAKASVYILGFLIPLLSLNKLMGINYDRNALQKGIISSFLMGTVVFILNFFLDSPYYLPFNLALGVLSYLFFIRVTKAMNSKDFEILDNLFEGRFRGPISMLKKVVV